MKRFGRVRLAAALFLMLSMMLSSVTATACALRFEMRAEKAKPVVRAAEDPCRHAAPVPHSCYTKYVPLTLGPGAGGALQAPSFVVTRVVVIFPDDIPLPVSVPRQANASLLARATAPPVCIRICSFQI